MTRCPGFVKYFSLLFAIAILAAALPAGAATYYVSTASNASNSNTGTQTSPWRTISYAASKAVAGDTVYIAGGNYGNEKVVVKNSGSSTKPIVFEGYNGTPLLNQGARCTEADYSSIGFLISSKSYITVRNMSATLYLSCFQVQYSNHITLENLTPYACGYTVAVGYGIVLISSDYCTLNNCTVTDCGGNDICLSDSDHNTLTDCSAIGTLASTNQWATDYYLVVCWSRYNTFTRFFSHDTTYGGKGNHGIGIKDGGSDTYHSTGNVFNDCTAWGLDEGLYIAHEAYGNTFNNCVGDFKNKYDPFATGIMVRDGAYNNTFNNCVGIGCGQAGALYCYAENTSGIQSGNHFNSCVFIAKERNPALPTSPIDYLHPDSCLFFKNAQNNVFDKCSFVNGKSVFRFGKNTSGVDANSGNVFTNCTIYNNPKWYDTQTLTTPWAFSGTAVGYDDTANITWTNCNFYSNGFTTPAGNMSFSPLFIDAANGNYLVPFGSLTASLSPAGAVTAGAMWRRVGQAAWRASGAVESDIMANTWSVEFLKVPGFDTPASQSITTAADTKTLYGVYAQMSLVWIDFAFAGAEYGTQAEPYKTASPAVSAVTSGGTVKIKTGHGAQPIRITKPVRIESSGGTATIGR
ncbi:right-handed parallel beta-helix repeat-containing protein [bacterium]|nr:right-handed parallel beta-helix repeat-containing protein [bacterium]